MEDRQLQLSKGKLDKLNREVSALAKKEQETRRRLDDERDSLNKITTQRTALVDRLTNAAPGDQAPAKLHSEIEAFDQKIKVSQRLIESFERLLAATKTELEAIVAERNQINTIVGQEESARAFQSWQADMQANFAEAHAAMEQARLALAKCTIESAKAGEKFGGVAQSWAAAEFDKFEHVEHNAETLGGFKQAMPWFRNVNVVIWPMVRRG